MAQLLELNDTVESVIEGCAMHFKALVMGCVAAVFCDVFKVSIEFERVGGSDQ